MSKNWFVTGASRGLGRAIVEAALENGDKVAATLRKPSDLADLAEAHPESLVVLELDVTDSSRVEAVVAEATEALGGLDVVVNNAGYADLASIEDTSIEAFRRQIDTNFLGVVYVTKAVLPQLRERKGRIINVSSVGGRVGNAGLSAYQAAKWAVNGFTEVLAAEVSGLGVKVTAIEPGGMQTDWAGSSMTIPESSAPYAETVGVLAKLFTEGAIVPLGDTRKVAHVVVDELVELDEPPVRLLLGSDAISTARAAERATAESDARWEQLSRSTDKEDASAAELDPLGHDA